MYQLLPPLTDEEYAALRDDIRERGVQVAVEFDENGVVLDGHHRLRACQELGIEDFPRLVRRGLTEQEKRSHVRALNLDRRHLNQEQKRELIRAQLRETPEKSDREIARLFGVSHTTVAVLRLELESSGQIGQSKEIVASNGVIHSREWRDPEPTLTREPAPPAFDLESEVERVAEALIREAMPAAMERALSQPLPEVPPRGPSRPAPIPTDSLASEPPTMQAINLSLSVERLAKHPMSGAEFKQQALPYTLARVREQIPAVIRLLQEIEKD